MTEPISDHVFGAHSNQWLRKAALYNVSQSMLWYGITRMLDYLDHNEDPDYDTAIEVLMQYSLNGKFVPVREHSCDEHQDFPNAYSYLDPTLEREAPHETVNPLSTEEQARLIDEFNATLGLVPEAKEEENDDT